MSGYMERRDYLRTIGAAAALGFAGCTDDIDENGSSEQSVATGTLATKVTDQPGDIGDFESCVVTLSAAYVLPEGEGGDNEGEEDDETEEDGAHEEGDDEPDATDNSSAESDDEEGSTDEEGTTDEEDDTDVEDDEQDRGRIHIEFEEHIEADLVELQGSNTQLVDETELEVNEYGGLHLEVVDVEGTLEGGDEAKVETPGNAPLKFNEPFEIRADELTTFVADFVPVKRGRRDDYLIKPVAQGTQVLYGDEEYDGGESEGDDEHDGESEGDDEHDGESEGDDEEE